MQQINQKIMFVDDVTEEKICVIERIRKICQVFGIEYTADWQDDRLIVKIEMMK